jgi:chorismate mutase
MTAVPDLMRAIDDIDDALVELLVTRFEHSRQIGMAKRALGQAPYDPERLRGLCNRFVERASERGLAGGMAQLVISAIVGQALVQRIEIFASVTPDLK